jgi:hypothetical protein
MLSVTSQFQYQLSVRRNSAACPKAVGAKTANWLKVRRHK